MHVVLLLHKNQGPHLRFRFYKPEQFKPHFINSWFMQNLQTSNLEYAWMELIGLHDNTLFLATFTYQQCKFLEASLSEIKLWGLTMVLNQDANSMQGCQSEYHPHVMSDLKWEPITWILYLHLMEGTTWEFHKVHWQIAIDVNRVLVTTRVFWSSFTPCSTKSWHHLRASWLTLL